MLPFVRVAGPRLPSPLPDTLELCRARPALPRLEELSDNERVPDVSIPQPCAPLFPFVEHSKEGDVQAQVELLFAKEGVTVAVLSPQGVASCFNLEFLVSLIKTNRVRALFISLPMHSWNAVSSPAQQMRE